MSRGYSLVELAVVLAIVGLVMGITLPRFGDLLDGIAVERAASELTTALAAARNGAVVRATRARLSIATDSLRIDEWGDHGWEPPKRAWSWGGGRNPQRSRRHVGAGSRAGRGCPLGGGEGATIHGACAS